MNRFLQDKSYDFKTFDEHIEYLEKRIKENEECIKECSEEIDNWRKEIVEIKQRKEAAEKEPTENHKPNVYLDDWKDSEEKKQEVYEWCQAHEIKYHPKVVGNFYEDLRIMPKYHEPSYEFITATSDTSKIRFVRCVDCYEKWIKDGKPEVGSDTYDRYLRN